ncbi:arginine-glutamic acid dipeptide repeat protein [Thalictrum thalictroides]|uniref:Arginine-glutamic acid dipeptide repeat protein n=1 Tax=Thalictrum thalictroides TaxID=46969 RepID=A0A7J6VQB1_THATH|nr:arginine-glutamic acid dipeptide repeat protein [Thalictrum thalictroides]
MMDSIEEDHFGEYIHENQDKNENQFISSDSPDVNDIFGDPRVLPRVGDQYQVDIPPLLTESDRLQLLKNPTDQDFMVDISHSFLMGLPIPFMWIQDKSDGTKNELHDFVEVSNDAVKANGSIESEDSKERNTNMHIGDSKVKVEPLKIKSDSGKGFGGLARCELTVKAIENSVCLALSQDNNHKHVEYRWKGYASAPGSISKLWSDFEQEVFLLGLYIFGKNLFQLKKFLGSKEMGDILSFYYGKFYRSDGYRRWSDCRKIKSRRCIHGHRLFTGWRQQELLSRLLPHASEECQNTLIEVSRRFGDGKILLEEYVSTLKAKVGVKRLIEAIGIGRGKQDLTSNIVDPLKANQVTHTRLEVPMGKACSSLTYEEIVKFLTGDFRLSKARASDLFWEAIWPRLLAKGWRSEQPKNQVYTGSKHSLVFLIPGIKKFSRRRLLKGSQYYDCVTDVLNKVASEPTLIELDVETQKGSIHDEEDECGTKLELEEDSHFNRQRHSFLQPRVANISSELMKITVVDTSLIHREEPVTVIKLRSLPANGSSPSISTKGDRDKCKERMDKLDSIAFLSNDEMENETSSHSKLLGDPVVYSDLSGHIGSVSKHGMPTIGPETTDVRMDFHDDGKCGMSVIKPEKVLQSCPINGPEHANVPIVMEKGGNSSVCDKNPSKMIKCQFSRQRKRGQSNNLSPVTKRRRLTACSHDDAARSTNIFCISPGEKEKELEFQLGSRSGCDNMVFEAGPSHNKVSVGSFAEGGPSDNIEDVLGENLFRATASPEKSLPHNLIDLNLPHVSTDSETSEKCTTKVENSQDYQCTNISSFSSEENHQQEDSQDLKISSQVAIAEKQTVTNGRRQSTRNRPLTTKALEALECGFLTTNRTWRGMEPLSEENLSPKPSRRARAKASKRRNFGDVSTSIADSKEQEGLDEEWNSDNLVTGAQVLNGRVS